MSAAIAGPAPYAARLEIDYPDRQLNRLTSAFRIFTVLPIMVVSALATSANFLGMLTPSTGLMILFRQRYPKWWFGWHEAMLRFDTRVFSYLLLMSDDYPSTEDEQHVHLEMDYPDAQEDLNRWLPLVKWLLAIPHYIVLAFLLVGVFFASIGAWFTILFTGRYPRGIFTFIVGVMRWHHRVIAYAFTLLTDTYPPFRLAA